MMWCFANEIHPYYALKTMTFWSKILCDGYEDTYMFVHNDHRRLFF